MIITEYQINFAKKTQENLYSKKWDEYGWNGERLYPVMLPLEEILRGSTARLHTPYLPHDFNVLGTPRSGTKWVQKILTLLMESNRKGMIRHKIKRLLRRDTSVCHFHEGVIEDFSPEQKILFVFRDIRDCIVSGYHYLRNGLNPGTMGCTPDEYKVLPKNEAVERQIIMYMKYRMPVLNHWFALDFSNLVKVRYEEMLADLAGSIKQIAERFGLDIPDRTLERIVDKTSFKAMSGRSRGTEDVASHQRKGIAGDWKNHFTERHGEIFRQMGGEDLLRSLGYEV